MPHLPCRYLPITGYFSVAYPMMHGCDRDDYPQIYVPSLAVVEWAPTLGDRHLIFERRTIQRMGEVRMTALVRLAGSIVCEYLSWSGLARADVVADWNAIALQALLA